MFLSCSSSILLSLCQVLWSKKSCAGKAVMLTGQHVPSDTEVRLYHRVLLEQGYHVNQGRYAETSSTLTHTHGGVYWICVEFVCLYRLVKCLTL